MNTNNIPGVDVSRAVGYDLDKAIGLKVFAWSPNADWVPTYMVGSLEKAPDALSNFEPATITDFVTRSVDPLVIVLTHAGEERVVPLICLRTQSSHRTKQGER